jgi:hypothetical protein
MPTMSDPVGIKELAARLGSNRRTIWVWRDEKLMPQPDYAFVNNYPAWEWAKVLKWAGDSGRLHHEPARQAYRDMFKKEPRAYRGGGPTPKDIRKVTEKVRKATAKA